MIRRKKSTFFLDAKDNTTVLELKRMVEGITKKSPNDQRLYNKDDAVSFCPSVFWRIFFSVYETSQIMLIHLDEMKQIFWKLKSRVFKKPQYVYFSYGLSS